MEVTSITIQQSILYIGTSSGHLFIADGFAMVVLCVLNGHPKNSITTLLTLTVRDNTNLNPDGNKLGVVSIGFGHYDLLSAQLGLEGLHNKNTQLYAVTWHSEHWEYTSKKKGKKKGKTKKKS